MHRFEKVNLKAIDDAVVFQDDTGNRVSFADLKNKVVYVDFWGKWCKGCMAQQPDYEKLANEFAANKDIVFLAINFYDKQEDWNDFISKKKQTYLHWKAKTEKDETMAEKLFILDSFPRYMLFGRDGELLSASAPTPGSKNIRRQLMKFGR